MDGCLLGFVFRLEGLEFVDFLLEHRNLVAELDPMGSAILEKGRFARFGWSVSRLGWPVSGFGRFIRFEGVFHKGNKPGNLAVVNIYGSWIGTSKWIG